MTKPWYRSKTNWIAIATFIAAVPPMFFAANTGLIGDEIALRITGVSAAIGTIIQFAVRTFWPPDALPPAP